MLPVVYTPAVGEAIRDFSHEYEDLKESTCQSLILTVLLKKAFENLHATAGDIDLIVATDSKHSRYR